MREISASIHIDTIPDQVWNTLTDLAGYRRRSPFIREATGQVAVGARLTGRGAGSLRPPPGSSQQSSDVVTLAHHIRS
jgi:hypothetical protein